MPRIALMMAMLLLFSSFAQADEWDEEVEIRHNSFGIGVGIPYGVLGANLDIQTFRNLNFSGGLGHTIIGGFAWNLGCKFYFRSPEQKFRPRVSAYYGVNAGTTKDFIFDDAEDDVDLYRGLTVGIGAQWLLGRSRTNGLDFDIMFILTTDWDEQELKEQGFDTDNVKNPKFSIGYRHAF